jgi:hypothetical protein
MGLQIQPFNLMFIDSKIFSKNFNQNQARDDKIDKLDLTRTRLVGDFQKGFFLVAKCQNGCLQLDSGVYV